MRIQGKHKKTAKRRLMKELRWGKKKWKTHVSVPRRSSMRFLGTRHRSSLQDPLDGMAPEEVDENVIPSFSPLNSLALSDGPFDFAEGGLSVEHETSQAEGGFSTVYETSQARGVILQTSTDNSARPEYQAQSCVERHEQQLARPTMPMLCGNTAHSAETELAPFMQVLATDSGVVTAEEHFEDSYVEVTQYSRDDTVEMTPAASNHIIRAAHHHEGRAAHHHEGRAAHHHEGRAAHHHEGRATHHHEGRAAHHHEGRAAHHHEGRAAHHHEGRAAHHHEGRAADHHEGRTAHHHEGRAAHHHEGRAAHHHEGRAAHHHEGRAAHHHEGRAADHHEGRAAHHHEGRAAHHHEGRAAHHHEGRAAHHHEGRAAHHHEARAARRQAARNQQQIIIQQEVAEANDISIGNPQPDDVDIHNDGIQHHASGMDVDLRARRLTRSHYRHLQNCATCFQGPRQTFNLPCRCLCNCLDCDRVMINCSMCQRPIRASVRCSLAT